MKIRLLNVEEPGVFPRYEKYLEMVSRERRERVERIKSPEGKSISLLAEVLMRKEIGKSLGIDEKDIKFSYGEQGKPYVESERGYNFSVSHTENIIVFTDSAVPVGIDIEKIRKARLKVAERFFTGEESERIFKLCEGEICGGEKKIDNEKGKAAEDENPSGDAADREFYRIWTMKEAYVKMNGQGLSFPFNSFNVDSEEPDVFFYNTTWKGYSISLCREGKEKEEIEITEVKL